MWTCIVTCCHKVMREGSSESVHMHKDSACDNHAHLDRKNGETPLFNSFVHLIHGFKGCKNPAAAEWSSSILFSSKYRCDKDAQHIIGLVKFSSKHIQFTVLYQNRVRTSLCARAFLVDEYASAWDSCKMTTKIDARRSSLFNVFQALRTRKHQTIDEQTDVQYY